MIQVLWRGAARGTAKHAERRLAPMFGSVDPAENPFNRLPSTGDAPGNMEERSRLLAAEPDVVAKLEQLSRDTTMAARLAAEAAVRCCLAPDV